MSKLKKIMVITLLLSLFGSISVFANDALDWYKGKRIQLTVNKNYISSGGLIVDGKGFESKTMAPVREVANALESIVVWNENTQTVQLFKPNVHMLTFQMVKDKLTTSFGKVAQGGKYDFVVVAEVDSVETDISHVKVAIVDPSGNELDSDVKKLVDFSSFTYSSKPFAIEFKQSGKYVVKFYMKPSNSTEYFLVSQKAIQSLSN